jgi:hypothetical protein
MEAALMLHDRDLELAWERWSRGTSLLTIATDLGVSASSLHEQLQDYLERRVEERRVRSEPTPIKGVRVKGAA